MVFLFLLLFCNFSFSSLGFFVVAFIFLSSLQQHRLDSHGGAVVARLRTALISGWVRRHRGSTPALQIWAAAQTQAFLLFFSSFGFCLPVPFHGLPLYLLLYFFSSLFSTVWVFFSISDLFLLLIAAASPFISFFFSVFLCLQPRVFAIFFRMVFFLSFTSPFLLLFCIFAASFLISFLSP